MYCALCFLTVPDLKKIEFGLVGIQTVGDLIGAIFYVIYVCQLYLQRFFFYCTADYAEPFALKLAVEQFFTTDYPTVKRNLKYT